MPLDVIQTKSQWKTLKSPKWSTKMPILKPFNEKVFNSVPAVVRYKRKLNCPVCLPVFLHTNDVHTCYIAVEVFEVFMTK